MSQAGLISFSKPHKILVIVLISLFILLVGLSLHQYSIPLWANTVGEDTKGGILLGMSQSIRQDDWGVEIPLMLAQVAHKPPFPVINTNIGNGINQLALIKVPVANILALFKPTTWGFFLGVDLGLSWMWWSMVFGLFYVFFLVFMIISRNQFYLSIMGSFFLLYSPFFQFWSMHASEIPIFMCLMFISYAYLITATRKMVLLGNAILLGWSSGCFMLNNIYPPFQVSLAFLLVFMIAGFIAERYSELPFNQCRTIRFGSLGISLAIVLLAAVIYYSETGDVINIISNTVYPGRRVSTGGDFEYWSLLNNNFLVHLYTVVQKGHEALNFDNWTPVGNICEYSSFIFLFPFLILVLIARCFMAKKLVDLFPLLIAGYISLIVVYMFWGFPEQVSKYTLFSYTPAIRELMGLGIANAVLLVTMLARPKYFELSKGIRFAVTIVWALLLILSAHSFYSKWTIAPLLYLVVVALFVAVVSYFLLSVKFSKAALAVLVVVSVLSTGWFNPLVHGGSQLFSESQLCRKILEIDADEKGRSSWVLFNGNPTLGNLFRILGVHSLSGTYPYPQLELWKKIDPKQIAMKAYNRYASVLFTPKRGPNIAFIVPANDYFVVGIDPNSDLFRDLGVTHFMVFGSDTQMFDQNPNLKRLFSFNDHHIYKLLVKQAQ